MTSFIRSISALAAVLALFLAPQARATSTDVVLNLEGNPTCSSLGDNAAIMEARDNSPTAGVNTATGPDGQEITYTLSYDSSAGVDEVTEWHVTAGPFDNINYTILKAKGNAGAKVFHFGAAGVPLDLDEDSNGSLSAVSFCYGLTGDTQPPALDMVNLGPCEDLVNAGEGLDGTGIACPIDSSGNPDGTEQRMIISLDISKTRTEPDFAVQFCTCNLLDANGSETRLPVCDPDLSRGEQGACTNNPEGINTRVPIVIQGVENPHSYICYTIGGRRTCYGSF